MTMNCKHMYTIIVTINKMIPCQKYDRQEYPFYDEDKQVTVYVAKSIKKVDEKVRKLLKKYERMLKLYGSPLYTSYTEYDQYILSIGDVYESSRGKEYIKNVQIKIFEAKVLK